jgi:hypothetical protein
MGSSELIGTLTVNIGDFAEIVLEMPAWERYISA